LKETPNSWIITTNNYDRDRKQQEKRKQNKPETNFNVFVCPECSRVHEHYYDPASGIEKTFHDDFPKYKLKRIACVECDGQ
tara:strand:+ start:416 stop:658 length:243 start_codon:yes stop_codon:yes gene_type:complete